MANTLRIKRRAAGGAAGAPSTLANAELAFNEQDNTLYYGVGTGGTGGSATTIIAIGGPGTFAPLASPALTGTPTAPTATAGTNTTQLATTAFVAASFAPLASPTLTGTPAAPTAAVSTNTTQIATTAYVLGQLNSTSTSVNMDGTQAAGTSLLIARADHTHPTDTSRAPLASPTFTGTPAAPTATAGTNTTQIATTAFVATSFAPLASPALTGTPVAPTAAVNTSTTQIATTAFVLGQLSSTTPAALGTAAVGTGTTFARADHVHVMPALSALNVPTASVSLNSQNITNLLDPVNPQDAATKNYVDITAQGLNAKHSVKAASTANLTLSGTQTVDGISLIAGDRVLVKNQTTTSQNGIYVVSASAWSRSTDTQTWLELVSAFTFVEQGTSQADTSWVCSVDQGGTLNTTAVAWFQFGSAAAYTAGNGLGLAGNTFSVTPDGTSLTVSGTGVRINATWTGQSTITTLGTITTGVWNGTAVTVPYGGTGATSLTGYVYGNGTGTMTASTTIPNTAITGLGTMSTQAASSVAITGGSITGLTTFDTVTIDGGTF